MSEQTKFGRLTLHNCLFHVNVYLNDVDVTKQTCEADDIAGYVDSYAKDSNGKFIFERENVLLTERRYGVVRIERRMEIGDE